MGKKKSHRQKYHPNSDEVNRTTWRGSSQAKDATHVPDNNTNKHKEQKKEMFHSKWFAFKRAIASPVIHGFVTVSLGVANMILVAFVVVQTRLASEMIDATREQVEIYKMATKDDLRAYLISEIQVHSPIPKKLLAFSVKVKNVGKTPARSFYVSGRGYSIGQTITKNVIDSLSRNPTVTFSIPRQEVSIGQGTNYVRNIFIRDHYWQSKEIAEIRSAKKILSIWGEARYADKFGGWHTLQFAVRYEGVNGVLLYDFHNEEIDE